MLSAFICSFKCHREDEYCIDTSEESDNVPIYCTKFGVGSSVQHLLALGNEDGFITIQNCNKPAEETPMKGKKLILNTMLISIYYYFFFNIDENYY